MRVLILSDKVPWPPDSGGARATLSMIKGMNGSGMNVTVLSTNTLKHYSDPGDLPDHIKTNFNLITVDTNTRINYISLIGNLLFSKKPYNFQRFYSKNYTRTLLALLKEKEFDIIQLEGMSLHHYLPDLKENTNVPVVLRSHNVENIIWSDLADEEKSTVKKFYFKALAKRIKKVELKCIDQVDALVAISSMDLHYFENNGLHLPAEVVFPTFDIRRIENPPVVKDAKRICYLGSLDWKANENGLLWFIDNIWPKVKASIPGIKFDIAGRNPGRKFLRKLSESDISYAGTPVDSSEFMKKFSLMIVPLFSGSGIRMKILESLSVGVPIISTTKGVSGLPGNLSKLINPTDDPALFASRIIDYFNRPKTNEEYFKMVDKIMTKNFSTLVQTEKLSKLYSLLSDDT